MTLVAGSYEKFIWGFSLKTPKNKSSAEENPNPNPNLNAKTIALNPLFSYPSHTAPIKTLAVSGPVAVSGGGDDCIKIYDLATSSEIGSVLTTATTTSLAFYSPPDLSFPRNLVAGTDGGTVEIYDADPFVHLKSVKVHKRAVADVAVHRSGRLALSVGRDGRLAMVNLLNGRRTFCSRLDKEAGLVKYGLRDSAGKDMFFMGVERKVYVHDSEDARILMEFEARSKVLCIAPGEGLIFSGGEDGRVSAWDTSSGKSMHLKIGHISQIVVSSSELAEQFLKTHDINYATRPYNFAANIITYNRRDVAFAAYGEYWRQMRKVCMQTLLSAKRVRSFDKTRVDENRNLVNILTNAATTGAPANLTTLLSTLTNNIVARSVFGDRCTHQEAFVVAMKEIFDISSGFNICDFFPSLEYITTRVTGWRNRVLMVHNTLDNIMNTIIDEYAQKMKNNNMVVADGEGNLLDVIFQIHKQNEFDFEFTMTNVKSIILDMFSGGTDSAFTTIEWAMSELMKKPKAMKKATSEVRKFFKIDVTKPLDSYDHSFYNDMGYMQNVIKETLRLHPPAPLLLPRECREDCQINDYDIEKKPKSL